ncbi:MAG: DUF357 domain-containing protein [Candidatus Diapherotrites archaeon CG09_land_8_20_14_0_10_32_12]|nr:MAG: DUF357 domain-containing protein [Candidatus Diapherotrites archaeon CG09_land_8_20_14_0_10_32_12]
MDNELILRCKKYLALSKKALKLVKISVAKTGSLYKVAEDFQNMAKNYISDGEYQLKIGNHDIALASFSYAHAWLDAGARLGIFEVKGNTKLFTLYKEATGRGSVKK